MGEVPRAQRGSAESPVAAKAWQHIVRTWHVPVARPRQSSYPWGIHDGWQTQTLLTLQAGQARAMREAAPLALVQAKAIKGTRFAAGGVGATG